MGILLVLEAAISTGGALQEPRGAQPRLQQQPVPRVHKTSPAIATSALPTELRASGALILRIFTMECVLPRVLWVQVREVRASLDAPACRQPSVPRAVPIREAVVTRATQIGRAVSNVGTLDTCTTGPALRLARVGRRPAEVGNTLAPASLAQSHQRRAQTETVTIALPT